jgi:hypothetical protein
MHFHPLPLAATVEKPAPAQCFAVAGRRGWAMQSKQRAPGRRLRNGVRRTAKRIVWCGGSPEQTRLGRPFPRQQGICREIVRRPGARTFEIKFAAEAAREAVDAPCFPAGCVFIVPDIADGTRRPAAKAPEWPEQFEPPEGYFILYFNYLQ